MNLNYKTYPSHYELYQIKWKGIHFDKEMLIQFVKRIKLLKFTSIFFKSHREELAILIEIYKKYDVKKLEGLLNNDPKISRAALIEKWSRIASVDILLTGQYSRNTFTTITNFPTLDYQLVIKRTEELIRMNKEFTYQSDKITNDIPGL